jgi:hypothetical protein
VFVRAVPAGGRSSGARGRTDTGRRFGHEWVNWSRDAFVPLVTGLFRLRAARARRLQKRFDIRVVPVIVQSLDRPCVPKNGVGAVNPPELSDAKRGKIDSIYPHGSRGRSPSSRVLSESSTLPLGGRAFPRAVQADSSPSKS